MVYGFWSMGSGVWFGEEKSGHVKKGEKEDTLAQHEEVPPNRHPIHPPDALSTQPTPYPPTRRPISVWGV